MWGLKALAALQAASWGARHPRTSPFGLSPGLDSPGPLGRAVCRFAGADPRFDSGLGASPDAGETAGTSPPRTSPPLHLSRAGTLPGRDQTV
jgi:hypothetical protein